MTYADTIQSPAPPPPPPYIGPPPEDFGFHDFSPTPEQIRLGKVSKISSKEQQKLWLRITHLIKSRNGYHTLRDVELTISVKLTLVASETGLEFWKSTIPGASLFLSEAAESKLFNTSSVLDIGWDADVKRPGCVSAAKAFVTIVKAGGVPLQQTFTNVGKASRTNLDLRVPFASLRGSALR